MIVSVGTNVYVFGMYQTSRYICIRVGTEIYTSIGVHKFEELKYDTASAINLLTNVAGTADACFNGCVIKLC